MSSCSPKVKDDNTSALFDTSTEIYSDSTSSFALGPIDHPHPVAYTSACQIGFDDGYVFGKACTSPEQQQLVVCSA